MSKIEQFHRELDGRIVADMLISFGNETQAIYGRNSSISSVGVGPMQTFLGWAVHNGYISVEPKLNIVGLDADITPPAIEGMAREYDKRVRSAQAVRGPLGGFFVKAQRGEQTALDGATAATLRALLARVRYLESENGRLNETITSQPKRKVSDVSI